MSGSAAVAIAVSGAGNGAAVVTNALLVQRGAPDRFRGRVFTALMSTNFAVLIAAMAVAGKLVDVFGPRWVWAGAACAFAVASVLGLVLARGVRPEARAEAEPPRVEVEREAGVSAAAR